MSETDELVERLRDALTRANLDCADLVANQIDELARLQAENARLRTLGEGMANG
jgi:hypothetical protein